jgi:hypothetical protein
MVAAVARSQCAPTLQPIRPEYSRTILYTVFLPKKKSKSSSRSSGIKWRWRYPPTAAGVWVDQCKSPKMP